MSDREVVILSGVRTAVADFGGALKDVPPTELAGKVIAEAVSRSGLEATDVGHCVVGSVVHSDRRDMYMGRTASLNAGLPIETPALTVNRLCGSGLQAVVSAAQMILLGDCDVAVAAGAESMSRAPYWLPDARFGAKMGDGKMVDPMMGALTCPIGDTHMGITAENLADKYSLSREEQDELAAESHRRAQRAVEENRFDGQILPIELKTRKGVTVFEQDEHIRFDCNAESMSGLRPAFKKDGTVTAGNASGINDGAAAVVLTTESNAQKMKTPRYFRLISRAVCGVEHSIMGTGPIPAISQALEQVNKSVDDMDVIELNEAFAAIALACASDLKIDLKRMNPNGGAIALGHPIGASGARILTTLIYALERMKKNIGLAALCIGGGEASAMVIEKL